MYADAGCGHGSESDHGDDCVSKVPCCADESIVFVAADHSASVDQTFQLKDARAFVGVDNAIENLRELDKVSLINSRAGPPLLKEIKLYLKHSSLTYYG